MMKKKVTSKSGLFLLELMISILFFSIAAVICVQVFVKAHLMSREARDLNMAVSCASSGAELLTHLSSLEELPDFLPGCEQGEEGQYMVHYDQEWKICEKEAAYAWMKIQILEEEQMQTGQITVGLVAKEEPMYRLEAGRYFPINVKEGDGNE